MARDPALPAPLPGPPRPPAVAAGRSPGLTLSSSCSHVALGTGGGAGHRPGSVELEPAAVAVVGWGARPLAPALRPHGRAKRLRAPRQRGSSREGAGFHAGPWQGRPYLPGA